MKRHKRDLPVMAQINITNLLDTALILLIAFMIVAPALKHGMDIDLPEVTAGPLAKSDPKTIGILKQDIEDGQERITLDGTYCNSVKDLEERLEEEYSRDKDVSVVIEADKSIPYETFMRVIAAVKAAGIENIGLVAEPEVRKR